MDSIDRELSELIARVGSDLSRTEDRARRRRLANAVRELDLKQGTMLLAIGSALEEHLGHVARWENLVGTEMLFYCLNTRAGQVLATTARAEGKDPFTTIAGFITRSAASLKPEMTTAAAFVKVRSAKAKAKRKQEGK